MTNLNGKPVIVTTSDDRPVSIGKFVVVPDSLREYGQRLELWFDTEEASCRLRINPQKVGEIERSWDRDTYRYKLPAGNSFWIKRANHPSEGAAK